MRTILILCLALLAGPAAAADWLLFCRTGSPVTALKPGEWACNRPTAIDNDTPALGVALCENHDILYHLDVNGDATASSATVAMRSCPTATADADACWIAENLTLDGNPATNTEAIFGYKALWIYGDLQNVGVIADPLISIACNLPRS